jgi:hypothetical protein
MSIPDSGTFDYEAEFTDESFRESDILLQGVDTTGHSAERLVGLRPKIRLCKDRLVIFTSEEQGAQVRHASFPAGDAVGLTARPGDRLYLCRTGTGDVGLSLLRQHRLILAVGTASAIPHGAGLEVIAGSDRADEVWTGYSANTWLEFSAGGERLMLREREFSMVGEYHVYVERSWESGMPGSEECISVCVPGDEAVRIAAIRSAVLMGHTAMKWVGWENTERYV